MSKPTTRTALTPEESSELVELYWKSHLPTLMQKELESALADGKEASIVRGRILDRFFGKPGDESTSPVRQAIMIQISSVDKETAVTSFVIEPTEEPQTMQLDTKKDPIALPTPKNTVLPRLEIVQEDDNRSE